MTEQVYATRLVDTPAVVGCEQWDALLALQASPTLFMQHAYLSALHHTGCANAQTGWTARWLLLEDSDGLAAAAPLYLKTHSYGEYVFDWAWADAYHRHGLAYYPKLLCAVPFTPVPGTRLLARDTSARMALARAIRDTAQALRLSSAHVLLGDDADTQALQDAGWMVRSGVQFHWQQDGASPVGSMEELLSRMQRHKRKNIVQERRRVAEAGIRFECFEGSQINEELWDFFHRCYTLTYRAHGSKPYLNRGFFAALAQAQAPHWLMFLARRGGEAVAASLVAIDRAQGCAYGRYWGCTEQIPLLHFEACYYQPLQWCINNGFDRFEGGAQGEHKMARGLLPVATHSAHWISDPRFASAVDDFLSREGQGVAQYLDELRERNPFKPSGASSSS
jgi:predicted N-acyltransferase